MVSCHTIRRSLTKSLTMTYIGTLPSLPFCQLLTEEQKEDIVATWNEVESCHDGTLKSVNRKNKLSNSCSHATVVVKECLNIFIENIKLPVISQRTDSIIESLSSTSLYNLRSKKRSVSFSDSVDCMSHGQSLIDDSLAGCMFGKQETAVYMTLFDDFAHQRTSSTQATASINKCLQVICDCEDDDVQNARFGINTNYCSTSTMSSVPQRYNRKGVDGKIHYSDVYFFGRKKEEPKSGMGSSGSKTKLLRSGNITAAPVKSEKGKPNVRGTASIQAQSQSNSTAAQTRKARGASAGTSTGKAVSIKDDKSDRGACPAAAGGTKGDMVATVSHIRIGPKEPCPVHGKDPCQGPKCIVASSGEEQAPVKVSTVTNPRRGVFELVIRRMTGAPLAKNELMLEWTPPPARPPPCGAPCPSPCSPPCRIPKCKMIVCRPSSCKPKCCKKGCKKPCGPMPCRSVPCKIPCGSIPCRSVPCKLPCGSMPCRSVPCKKCCKSSCCGKPCRPCKPCPPPPKCRPCPPSPCTSPCAPPCCKFPCTSPCKSSPCLRPCPVGRKKPRKARSQPRIKSHKKRISPCCNRSKTCPVVRCRSVPGPCFICCTATCLPRKCCSVAPCKPLKCCKSSCSSCCG